ncbi:hypothetical protein AQUCO_00900104v1 [Aquilegia coerulea]|uniref:F-box domain-containing protein n=1 Tax=Aquilegia coerulea TaxID=218851 RepID=A0A2G5EC01_AQUCA|nr:hypothetical protein AQUCO_00900104v1 [Aquilegia coerulea]PIA53294.1 hypothetical protein AQUCO_00900104v1 [Aquilegia coerulea]
MEDDRISCLPEEIRDHIVSYLSMEEAIRTSVLSRKWRKVCSSLTNLKFKQSYFERVKRLNLQQFIEIINQTLAQHDGSDINKFELLFDVAYKEGDQLFVPHLNEWVSFAVNHNVRKLYIWGKDWQKFRFTSSSLTTTTTTYDSLEILTLGVITLQELPRNIKFPNLKSLILLMLDVSNATVIQQLLSASPMLDYFSMSLRYIKDDSSNKILHITPANLSCFCLRGWKPFHQIKFCSKNIQKLLYQGEPPKFDSDILSTVWQAKFIVNTGLPSSPRIALRHALNYLEALLGLPSTNTTATDHHWASKILMDLRNVFKLHLGCYFVEFLTMERGLLARLPTSCSNLKHLTLDLYPTKNQVQVITFLLKSYPNLQVLYINIKQQYGEEEEEEEEEEYTFNMDESWKTEELNTDGMLEQLNGVQIESFKGSESEFDLVRFLLGNAGVLQDMNIILSKENQTDAATSFYIKEKIEMLTRASPIVDVSVSEIN